MTKRKPKKPMKKRVIKPMRVIEHLLDALEREHGLRGPVDYEQGCSVCTLLKKWRSFVAKGE